MPQAQLATDLDAFIATATLAYVEDPVMRFMVPSPARFLACAPGMVRAGAELAFAHASAFAVNDHAGVALFFPPGVRLAPAAVGELMQRAIGAERLPSVMAAMAPSEAHAPREPCWYLQMIGVDPMHRGRGLGSALLEAATRRIDEAGDGVFVQCSHPRNVPLYERFGFTSLADVCLADDVHLIPMWRPPA